MGRVDTYRCLFVALSLSLVAGCNRGEYVPVEGLVTFEGQPVVDATVTFQPEGDGPLSVGTTAADGTFQLALAGNAEQQGAKVGPHRVMISAIEVQSPQASGDPKLGSLVQMSKGEPRIKNRLPDRYADVRTSNLTFDVSSSGSNSAKFELRK